MTQSLFAWYPIKMHARPTVLLAASLSLVATLADAQSDRAPASPRPVADAPSVQTLARLLNKEPDYETRWRYVQTLGKMNTPAARKVLALRTLVDPIDEVRYSAMDYFEYPEPEIVEIYVHALKSADDQVVNRAAEGLKVLKDPSVVEDLIAALITTHTFKVRTPSPTMFLLIGESSGSAVAYQEQFGTLTYRISSEVRVVTQIVSNQKVLDALISLTGEDFQFDVERWKRWLAPRKLANAILRDGAD